MSETPFDMPEVGNDEFLDLLVARWVKLTEELRVIEKQRGEIARLILSEPGMKTGTKRGRVSVMRQKRFDPDKAKDILTAEDYERICEWVPSAKLAERELDPDLLDMIKTQRATRYLQLGSE